MESPAAVAGGRCPLQVWRAAVSKSSSAGTVDSQELLERLDAAIDTAITTEEMIDEINAPPDPQAQKASRRY
jgi:hypothetical protein